MQLSHLYESQCACNRLLTASRIFSLYEISHDTNLLSVFMCKTQFVETQILNRATPTEQIDGPIGMGNKKHTKKNCYFLIRAIFHMFSFHEMKPCKHTHAQHIYR